MMNKIKTTAIAAMFMIAAGLATSASEDERFEGGSFDGWDALAPTNVFYLGDTKMSFSSGANQQFDFTEIFKALLPCVITAEDPNGQIVGGGCMRLCVPADWLCCFDNTAAVNFGGSAAGKVGVATYEDGGRTLRIPVTQNFVAEDVLTVSGLRIMDCRLAGPAAKALELDFNGDGASDLYDEYDLIVAVEWAGGSYDGWSQFATLMPVFLGAKGSIITFTQLFGDAAPRALCLRQKTKGQTFR